LENGSKLFPVSRRHRYNPSHDIVPFALIVSEK
jgi:hypothetical protein